MKRCEHVFADIYRDEGRGYFQLCRRCRIPKYLGAEKGQRYWRMNQRRKLTVTRFVGAQP